MASRLIFKLLYPFCSSNTKIILSNMDDKTELIQRCIDEKLKYQIENEAARMWAASAIANGNFGRWIKILEVGTFNLIERLAIKAALHKHKREATKKIICSTLIDGEYTSDKTENYTPADKEAWQDAMIDELEAGKTETYDEILEDWNKCK